jgi:cobalt/nickel transport system ATP-binding protein
MENNCVFELTDVTYDYMDNVPAIKSLNLKIHKGETIAILGANGSGKSTLLKLLDGLYAPTKGKFQAFGSVINEATLRDKKTARDFHRKVGLIFQDPDVQLFLPTVWDEVAFAPLQLGLSKEKVTEVVSEALTKLELYHLKDRAPYHLSEGEKKKVSIASVLTLDPEVWLMDEPTASLDPRTQGWVIDFILELSEKGKTTVVATHDLEIPHVATSICYVLGQDHKILVRGATHEILNREDILIQANLIHQHRHIHINVAYAHKHWHF